MSRYIDSDAIKVKAWKAESEACFYELEDVVSVTDIDEAPSIDIVRCKDCRHSEESLVSGSVYCNEMDRAISENGFCHKGERKEGE